MFLCGKEGNFLLLIRFFKRIMHVYGIKNHDGTLSRGISVRFWREILVRDAVTRNWCSILARNPRKGRCNEELVFDSGEKSS